MRSSSVLSVVLKLQRVGTVQARGAWFRTRPIAPSHAPLARPTLCHGTRVRLACGYAPPSRLDHGRRSEFNVSLKQVLLLFDIGLQRLDGAAGGGGGALSDTFRVLVLGGLGNIRRRRRSGRRRRRRRGWVANLKLFYSNMGEGLWS